MSRWEPALPGMLDQHRSILHQSPWDQSPQPYLYPTRQPKRRWVQFRYEAPGQYPTRERKLRWVLAGVPAVAACSRPVEGQGELLPDPGHCTEQGEGSRVADIPG